MQDAGRLFKPPVIGLTAECRTFRRQDALARWTKWSEKTRRDRPRSLSCDHRGDNQTKAPGKLPVCHDYDTS
jgi:hypothetical protein